MANLSGEEHHYRRAMDEESELPPGTANPPRGRPVTNPPPPHFSHEPPHDRTPYEVPPPNVPDPRMSRPEPNFHHPYGSGPHSNPPPYSGYRPPPNHPPYRHSTGPSRYSHHQYPQYDGYWRHNPSPRYRPNHTRAPFPHGAERAQECADLYVMVGRLGHEIEDLKNQATSQQSSFKEQLDITTNQNQKLAAHLNELRQLKEQAVTKETEAAVKDEEIKQLKVKNEMYHRKIDGHCENIGNLGRRAEQHEKERMEKQTELHRLQDDLEKGQSEIRMAKAELQKKNVEARNGRALIQRLRQEIQTLKTQSQNKQADVSLQKTFTEVLDHSNQQGKTIAGLALNMSMQKIEYDHIVNHFTSGYREIYKEFRHLLDIQREEYELKEATTDSRALESASYNRPVDVLCMELQSNFQLLDSLSKDFSELSDQTGSQSVPASGGDQVQASSGWPDSGWPDSGWPDSGWPVSG